MSGPWAKAGWKQRTQGTECAPGESSSSAIMLATHPDLVKTAGSGWAGGVGA